MFGDGRRWSASPLRLQFFRRFYDGPTSDRDSAGRRSARRGVRQFELLLLDGASRDGELLVRIFNVAIELIQRSWLSGRGIRL